MATRTLAAVTARRSGLAAVLSSSCRRGGAQGLSHSSAQRREDQSADRHDAVAVTAAQAEASLNRKNVEVVQGDRSATLLPDEAVDALGGVGAAEAEHAWVPDQETGVFAPAEEAAGNGNGGPHEQPAGGPSVLDQTVFVREDMEDLERPPMDMANAHGEAK
ncbi:hypothetical protein BAE44_0020808 [Dichanthelium oligosanthes]|uniref:Uncharacterized protein n=1 Tax=Dichanthelium oligosanthes TaxID=888268 RepID=A0A1E5UZ41_9POAL|nr:hypothetical protein BAE44_0020808 [Dichanthelium oligosanthes]